MKNATTPLTILTGALLFTVLFYKQDIGLNLLLFEVFLSSIILFVQRNKLLSKLSKLLCATTLISGIAFVINYTAFALVTNILSAFLLTGALIYPRAQSLLTSFKLSLTNLYLSVQRFLKEVAQLKAGKSPISIGSLFYFLKIIVLPLVIVGIFLGIYNISSPFFNKFYLSAADLLNSYLKEIDINLVLVFTSGLFCSIFPLIRIPVAGSIERDRSASLFLFRVRRKVHLNNPYGFKREVIAAKFLLVTLNCLILIVNILDIPNVWFHFSWSGSYLKQFVHEGTYLLIISILISIAIALYFFRGNVNFYKKSKLLRILTITWLAQNAILAISVGFRNFWYIHYFALAYKRIGVIFFLLLTLYGIYTVIVKIKNKHSGFYLFRNNSMALFMILVGISLFNWDNIIARYNFAHYKTSFVHYDFLADLPAKSLPYLDKSTSELKEIESYQQQVFKFDMKYLSANDFSRIINIRKELFKKYWESKTFLSWNYAEHNAYKQLQ